ncbi:MAG TPA: DHA2 family efflux MFS transporter permease subunit [Mycobacteriales bacterium]|jgi:EmrB/QacA subfamily drug resistance transporter
MTPTDLRARRRALYALCTGMLMIVLDATIVNVALPSIREDLGFSAAGLAWVINAYLIAFGGLLLLAGRLGDLAGQRRIFLVGLAVFTAASVACGAAVNPAMLIAARFVQGAGGALTSAVILGLIVTLFPEPREQARAVGVYAFVASAGGAVGLLAGGALTQWVTWHWIFFVNVPIGLATMVAAVRLLPAGTRLGVRAGADVLGAVLITSALMLGVYTLVVPAAEDGWTGTTTLVCGAISVALVVAFLVRQATAAAPLMPLRILRSSTVAGANVVQALGASGMFGSFFLGALYLQQVLGYGPLEIGLAFLPVTVLMGGLSVRYSERLITRFGAQRVMVTGLLFVVAGLVLFAIAPVDARYVVNILPAAVVIGIGAGLCFPPTMTLAMTGVRPSDAGLASGLVNTTAQVGGAIGLSILTTVSAERSTSLRESGSGLLDALTGGYHAAFWIAAVLIVAALATALTVLRPARTAPVQPVEPIEQEPVPAAA